MANRVCPACGKPVENNISPSGQCLSCGHDLVATAPPPAWKLARIDLRLVAKRQRILLWFVLAVVALNVIAVLAAAWPRMPLWIGAGNLVIALLVQVSAIVAIVQLQAALGVNVAWRVVCGLLMLAPCLNLLVLISVNSQATSELKRAGLKVGIMGVSDEQVVRLLSPNRCTACGYILAVEGSSNCPECGAATARTA